MYKIYFSKSSDKLNTMLLNTEFINPYVCINPNYPNITISNPKTKLLIDSGAFQDLYYRTTFEKALHRQLELENKIGILSQKIVAYDKIKDANTTLESNKFLADRRDELSPRKLVLMLQGKTTEEYINCFFSTLKYVENNDTIGIGGISQAGKNKRIRNILFDTIESLQEYMLDYNLKNLHVFGIGTFKIITEINNTVSKNINLSFDTSSYEISSVMGKVFDLKNKTMIKVFEKEDKFIKYHPCKLCIYNMLKIMELPEVIKD